jgi:tRNA-splicing ligase RtcB (3'-phosphate/5'-hydroxy nucleic acid ligase)
VADSLSLQGYELRRNGPAEWEIPASAKPAMRVPARIIASESLLRAMDAQVFEQVTNVATLPGVLGSAWCMPDGHSGYGFPIGGVAAMDAQSGVISPGGIGFDINCGMRLVLTNLTVREVEPRLKELVDELFHAVPAGVGSTGFVKLSKDQFRKVAEDGARWCLQEGMAWQEDLDATELGGAMDDADTATISQRAVDRGHNQIGTLGSGNHYLEIQRVRREDIHDQALAKAWGIFPDQVVVMFHCGSRGFGHQIASDYLATFLDVAERKYGIAVLDRELASAPFQSPEGQAYYTAMKCGVNMSFANRQVILHRIREVFGKVFRRDPEAMGLRQLFDVAHNRASLEEHEHEGKRVQAVVHRKGATGSYPPGRPEVPPRFRAHGSPVIIGGSMETGSYLLAGAEGARRTWCSTAHGAGRTMSRTAAKRQFRGEALQRDMLARGIYVRSVSFAGLAEEAGPAYKDIDSVIAATHEAGLSKRVVRLTPMGNVKG